MQRTLSEKDIQTILKRVDVVRHIPELPFRLSPLHIEINAELEDIEIAIKTSLAIHQIHYQYPDSVSIFNINHSLGGQFGRQLHAEIRIYANHNTNPNKYTVEFHRYGGDGFLLNDIFYRVCQALANDG